MYEYMAFYRQYFERAWANMSPMEYGYLLVTIAVIGYLSMRSHR